MINQKEAIHLGETLKGYVAHTTKGVGRITKHGTIKWLSPNYHGHYPTVNIKGKTRAVHKIMLGTFRRKPRGKCIAHHINRDTSDFRLSNLKWIAVNQPNSKRYTESEKENYRRFMEKIDRYMKNNPDKFKADSELYPMFRLRHEENWSYNALGRKFGLSNMQCHNIINGRQRRHLLKKWRKSREEG